MAEPLGRLLLGDYTDPRYAAQTAKDRKAVRIRVERFSDPAEKARYQKDLIKAVHERHQMVAAAMKIRQVANPHQTRLVQVEEDELLVRLADSSALGRLEQVGNDLEVEVRPVAGLENRVVRIRRKGGSTDLDEVGKSLAKDGFDVRYNHITPLAVVAKGRGGPEPSPSPDPQSPTVESGRKDGPVVVAVIDTGIAALDHQGEGGNWLVGVQPTEDNIDPLDVFPPIGTLDLAAGHGTFVAGLVRWVAPAAQIRMYRAVDSDGVGSEADVAEKMITAVEEGADVLNLSLGIQTIDDQPPVALDAALDWIQGNYPDVAVVAAAGNFGEERECWPAADQRVISVAGLTAEGTGASWSSRGVWVTMSAIGEGVRSTYVRGKESPIVDPEDPDPFGNNPWAVWTGSSFAAPQVAGAIARLCEGRESLTPPAAAEILRQSGPQLPLYGTALVLLPGT